GDNGQNIFDKKNPNTSPYLFEDFVYSLRPTWQEGMESIDERFLEAVAIARQVIKREISHAKAQVAAIKLVREIYDETEDKRVIVFDTFYPHEKILSSLPEPLFSVFPRVDGLWNVKAVRDDSSVFINRKDFPESWAGKRDSELAEITGVDDATFC